MAIVASYPLDGGPNEVIERLREDVARSGLPLHEGAVAPSGGDAFRIKRLPDGFEFGLVPRDAFPAEVARVRFDEDNVATIEAPRDPLRQQLTTVALALVAVGLSMLPVWVTAPNVWPTMMGVAAMILGGWLLRRRLSPVEARRRKVLQQLQGAMHPLVRSALPGSVYR